MHPAPPIPQVPRRIVLVGFMGAGKSTIGPLLAERLGWRFIDADSYLQAKTGSTISELFIQQGEPAFRQLEADVFAELHREGEVVIALGGGAVETEPTRSLLEQANDTCVVYLRAPLEVLIERCEKQPGAAVRPVLRRRDTLNQRFHARLPHYERAHIAVDTEGLHPHDVVDRILHQLVENIPALPLTLKAMAT
jgi:shikimate kinase